MDAFASTSYFPRTGSPPVSTKPWHSSVISCSFLERNICTLWHIHSPLSLLRPGRALPPFSRLSALHIHLYGFAWSHLYTHSCCRLARHILVHCLCTHRRPVSSQSLNHTANRHF